MPVRLALVIRVHVIVRNLVRRVLMFGPVHVWMGMDVLMLVLMRVVVRMRVRFYLATHHTKFTTVLLS